jgi:hypothetical protein
MAILLVAFAYAEDIARTLRTNTQDNNDPDNFMNIRRIKGIPDLCNRLGLC